MKKKILISVLLSCVALIILSNIVGKGCIVYHEWSFKGKVIDAETKEPIEGAVVVALYKIIGYSIPESRTIAVDAKEVLTNKDGDFYISPHLFFYFYPIAKKETTEFVIYKPGYTAFPGLDYFHKYFSYSSLEVDTDTLSDIFKKDITVELQKLKTKEERIRNIPGGIDDMGAWKLTKLFKAINE